MLMMETLRDIRSIAKTSMNECSLMNVDDGNIEGPVESHSNLFEMILLILCREGIVRTIQRI